ncbi:DUF1080 domain-containing protein [Hyunsoonleella sp. SJ7]|uniref:DUF1080 domain-containing protein n=1 Tax=Hyunsoonleella aquatilis TaxID=2762758 RepID=A0A923KKC2_9FLAO|nr:DUF1080 domain-containing protein [Hyunsoonleella aquatilis]MBC3758347.1 DUF1080 domain-containing protein [Hyunsoonleella aquatilis]
MKTKLAITIAIFIAISCKSEKKTALQNTDSEIWMPIFNGKDLSDWTIKFTGEDLNVNYKNTFVVEDSMLRIKYDDYKTFNNKFAHIYYNTPYSYYKLRFDYRFTGEQTEGGAHWNVRNSGVMLHSQSAKSNAFDQNFPVSVELQLLGGLNDKKQRPTGNVCTPGTAVVMSDTINYEHCIRSNSKTYFGNNWVHAEALVLGGESMAFLIENDTVLKFTRPQIGSFEANGHYNGEHWKDWGINPTDWKDQTGKIVTEGYIALQAESHPIDFKNIELLDLCGCMDQKAKNYKSYYVKHKPESCEY